jgi:hypothetical protein
VPSPSASSPAAQKIRLFARLAAGWKFRSVLLEQDLILTPDQTGTAHITQDNFGNTYDRAGGEYSNFKP